MLSQICRNGDLKEVQKLFNHKDYSSDKWRDYIFKELSENGHSDIIIELVKQLLSKENVGNYFLKKALFVPCYYGHVHTFKKMYNSYEKFYCDFHEINSPQDFHNQLFRISCQSNSHEIVKELLQNPIVNPSFNNNYGINHACEHNYVDIVKILLEDPRIDPSDFKKNMLYTAVVYNRHELIKILLKDSRISLSIDMMNFYYYSKKILNHEIIKEYLSKVCLLEFNDHITFLISS